MEKPETARDIAARGQTAEDALPTHSEDGVDLTLIRWMLSLTPEQRLEHLQDHARTLLEMRDAFRSA